MLTEPCSVTVPGPCSAWIRIGEAADPYLDSQYTGRLPAGKSPGKMRMRIPRASVSPWGIFPQAESSVFSADSCEAPSRASSPLTGSTHRSLNAGEPIWYAPGEGAAVAGVGCAVVSAATLLAAGRLGESGGR